MFCSKSMCRVGHPKLKCASHHLIADSTSKGWFYVELQHVRRRDVPVADATCHLERDSPVQKLSLIVRRHQSRCLQIRKHLECQSSDLALEHLVTHKCFSIRPDSTVVQLIAVLAIHELERMHLLCVWTFTHKHMACGSELIDCKHIKHSRIGACGFNYDTPNGLILHCLMPISIFMRKNHANHIASGLAL